MNYPVQGYRKGAKKYRTGLSNVRPIAPNPEIERLLARALEPPWGGRPRNTLMDDEGGRRGAGAIPLRSGSRIPPGFLGALKAPARRLPWLGQALQLYDVVQHVPAVWDYFATPDETVPASFDLRSGAWTMKDCGRVPQWNYVRFNNCTLDFSCSLVGQLLGTPTEAFPGVYLTSPSAMSNAHNISVWEKVSSTKYSIALQFRRAPGNCPGLSLLPVYTPEHTVNYLFPRPQPDRPPVIDALGQMLPMVTNGWPSQLPYALRGQLRTNLERAPSERTEIYIPPLTRPPVSPPPPARPRPPGRRVKERKWTIFGLGRWRPLLERVTETLDLAECVASAAGAPPGPIADRLAWTYRHADQIDGCRLVECIINNEIEDAVVGLVARVARAEARATGRGYTRMTVTRELELFEDMPRVSLGC